MAIRTNADLDFMLRDAGVPVVTAAASTFGIFRRVDTVDSTDGAGIQTRGTTITVRSGTISDLEVDLPITVDGRSYEVRWYDAQDDGQLTKILIAEVTS